MSVAEATGAYLIHPLANLIPSMTEGEFAELREDIAANGQHQPILMFENQVLDGRHRLRACEDIGLVPRFEKYTGDEPAKIVMSLNLKRRHLSDSQRAMIAADFIPALEEEKRRRPHLSTAPRDDHGRVLPNGAPNGAPLGDGDRVRRAADDAADIAGAKTRTVQRAKRIIDTDPALADQVRRGEKSVWTAEQEAIATGMVAVPPKKATPAEPPSEPEPGRVSARSAERVALQAGALSAAVDALNLTKSCARLTEDEREKALDACKRGLKALNALANALGR